MSTTDAPASRHDRWPIAAAMLQFPGSRPDGTSVREAGPEAWTNDLRQITDAGFAHVEIPSAWLPLGDLTVAEQRALADVLHALRLNVPGTSVVRRSILHPTESEANVALSHRTIDVAAHLGIPIVCLGLHDQLTDEQQNTTWFWTLPGETAPSDPDAYRFVVNTFRQLGQHAAAVGLQISLELYEDTFLGSGAGAARLISDIDEPAVGLNPDLGNLIRANAPVPAWHDILEATLPHTNYWHVKNYQRAEDPSKQAYFAIPSTMRDGYINYRHAVRAAVDQGYTGAFVVEHYGGDGLGVGAANRDYLEDLLSTASARTQAR